MALLRVCAMPGVRQVHHVAICSVYECRAAGCIEELQGSKVTEPTAAETKCQKIVS
mgnify:CR=1 FL=1